MAVSLSLRSTVSVGTALGVSGRAGAQRERTDALLDRESVCRAIPPGWAVRPLLRASSCCRASCRDGGRARGRTERGKVETDDALRSPSRRHVDRRGSGAPDPESQARPSCVPAPARSQQRSRESASPRRNRPRWCAPPTQRARYITTDAVHPIAEMAPYLATLLADSTIAPILNVDKDLLAQLQAKNAETLTQLDAKLEDATKNLGETEVSDALRTKATHLAKIGENVRPHPSYHILLAIRSDTENLAHSAPLFAGIGIGSSRSSSQKDRRTRFQDRHSSHHDQDRLLPRRQRRHFQKHRSRPNVITFAAHAQTTRLTLPQLDRRRRRLGSTQSPESVSRTPLPLRPKLQSGRRAVTRYCLDVHRNGTDRLRRLCHALCSRWRIDAGTKRPEKEGEQVALSLCGRALD